MFMITKPWPIIILSWIYFLAPIPNLVISSYLSGRSIPDYLMNFSHPLKLIVFFTFFPIAGFAIYRVKKWSYPVFVIVMLWSFWVNFSSFSRYPENYPIFLLSIIYVVNFALVGYFLIPAVREVYFNPRLRWWESKPRYEVEIDVEIDLGFEKKKAKIKNLSMGGIFLEPEGSIEINTVGILRFAIKNYELNLEGKFLYCNPSVMSGYGVEFQNLSSKQKKELKKLTAELDRDGVKRRPERTTWGKNFKEWVTGVLSSGKGVVPEIPDHLKRKKP